MSAVGKPKPKKGGNKKITAKSNKLKAKSNKLQNLVNSKKMKTLVKKGSNKKGKKGDRFRDTVNQARNLAKGASTSVKNLPGNAVKGVLNAASKFQTYRYERKKKKAEKQIKKLKKKVSKKIDKLKQFDIDTATHEETTDFADILKKVKPKVMKKLANQKKRREEACEELNSLGKPCGPEPKPKLKF